MDERLLEAAQIGNVDYLHQLLKENPLILHDITLFSSENPLHIASIAGHIDFVKEIQRLKPEFAKETNQHGFSPLHMAAANGHEEVVRELVKVDSRLCRLKGKEKKTPLHCAAIKGKAEVISAMILACPDSIEDVTVQGETALHLAVKNNQLQAVNVLVDWIRAMKREDMLGFKDELGNTVLHLAAWKKQRHVIELFLGAATMNSGIFELNAINNSGLTALDLLLIIPSEAGDTEIVEILRAVGALRAKDIDLSSISSSQSVTLLSPCSMPETRQTSEPGNLVDYFKFKKGRDSPSDVRSALLVIAVLVATATFQAGVNPPGGAWQDDYIPDHSNSTAAVITKAHFAGKSILATSTPKAYAIIVLFNSIGLSVSLSMIMILTSWFPLQLELLTCIIAIYVSYNTAVVNMTTEEMKLFVILTTSILSSLTALLVKELRLPVKNVVKFIVDTSRHVIWQKN